MPETIQLRKTKITAITAAAALLVLVLLACRDTGKSHLTSPPVDLYESFHLADTALALAFFIQDSILKPRCWGCHQGDTAVHDLLLTRDSPIDLIGQASAGIPDIALINPGSPDSSYLIWKLEATQKISGSQMPPYLPLSPSQIALIRKWIKMLGDDSGNHGFP